MRQLMVCIVLGLISFTLACKDDPADECSIPQPANSDTLHGQYTWTDNTVFPSVTVHQFSIFQFRADAFGAPSVFTMRVDTARLVPERRFGDLTATYRLISNKLFVESVVFKSPEANSNTPFGEFLFACTQDSFIFLGGSIPGAKFSDTLMRISIRR